jgi:hypothetical protein
MVVGMLGSSGNQRGCGQYTIRLRSPSLPNPHGFRCSPPGASPAGDNRKLPQLSDEVDQSKACHACNLDCEFGSNIAVHIACQDIRRGVEIQLLRASKSTI